MWTRWMWFLALFPLMLGCHLANNPVLVTTNEPSLASTESQGKREIETQYQIRPTELANKLTAKNDVVRPSTPFTFKLGAPIATQDIADVAPERVLTTENDIAEPEKKEIAKQMPRWIIEITNQASDTTAPHQHPVPALAKEAATKPAMPQNKVLTQNANPQSPAPIPTPAVTAPIVIVRLSGPVEPEPKIFVTLTAHAIDEATTTMVSSSPAVVGSELVGRVTPVRPTFTGVKEHR